MAAFNEIDNLLTHNVVQRNNMILWVALAEHCSNAGLLTCSVVQLENPKRLKES